MKADTLVRAGMGERTDSDMVTIFSTTPVVHTRSRARLSVETIAQITD